VVADLLTRRGMEAGAARKLAAMLSEGTWTHDYPLTAEVLRDLGLPVSTELPDEVRELISLYPQPRGRRPSVEYIPQPYRTPKRKAPQP
jgi:ClpP class serine protease